MVSVLSYLKVKCIYHGYGRPIYTVEESLTEWSLSDDGDKVDQSIVISHMLLHK